MLRFVTVDIPRIHICTLLKTLSGIFFVQICQPSFQHLLNPEISNPSVFFFCFFSLLYPSCLRPIFSLLFRRYEYFCSVFCVFFLSSSLSRKSLLFSFCSLFSLFFFLPFHRLSVLLRVFLTYLSSLSFLSVFISSFLSHRLFLISFPFSFHSHFCSFVLPFHTSENLFHASLSSLQQLLCSLVGHKDLTALLPALYFHVPLFSLSFFDPFCSFYSIGGYGRRC